LVSSIRSKPSDPFWQKKAMRYFCDPFGWMRKKRIAMNWIGQHSPIGTRPIRCEGKKIRIEAKEAGHLVKRRYCGSAGGCVAHDPPASMEAAITHHPGSGHPQRR